MVARTDEVEADGDQEPSGIFGRAVRWLRDLHRGYAYTGHLPRRRR